jgi:hypothetical protein
MNLLPPLYKFLLATFTADPDDVMDKIFNNVPINMAFFPGFNDIIQNIARNEVSMHELPKLNDEVIGAWEELTNWKWKSISNDKIASPFEFLKRTVEKIMRLERDTPYFKINNTEIWSSLTRQMGEDLFSSLFFADRQMKHGVAPGHFQWNYMLHSDFHELNHLLKEEKINENHYHLFGSSPNVDLSWLFLMNNPDNQERKFTNFERNFALEQRNISTHAAFKQTRLYWLVKIAAYIRVRLFEKCCLNLNEWRIWNILEDIRLLRTFGFIINDAPYPMQTTINIYKRQSYHRYENKAVDYAIQNFDKKENLDYLEIAGERHLYYCCLKRIFEYKEESIELQILFYLYLLIKNKFGGIFIQRNNKYGFDNFHRYEKTKFDIIEGTLYEKLAVKMAVKYNMRENFIDKLELRITPKNKEEELKNRIENCDKFSKEKEQFTLEYINDDKKPETGSQHPHFYVIHFIKNKKFDWGTGKDSKATCVCRELKLREKIEKEAKILHELRKNARDFAFRIYGIDAASHEINCRPEIFGQVFRYLSDSNISYPFLHYDQTKIALPHLKKTYHAGEDFYDIMDGLRSIDEAILFLHLRCGDRIGHAVALGIEPEKYYNDRPHIAMPLQNALDNYAWMLHLIGKHHVVVSQSFILYLKSQFDRHFNTLYGDLSPDLLTYMEAWKLRGDNPDCYSKTLGDTDNLENITEHYLKPVTPWNKYALCYRERYKNINRNAYKLYHRYHFDNELKKKAMEIVDIDVDDEYVALAKQLQTIMRHFVLNKKVAIESNPSSNFLISNLDKTIELPVFKLFPIEESGNEHIRLNVSVNTDDQGVFYTSLVKEYTLLAGALQNEHHNKLRKHSDHQILTWIKHLVDNGKSQCFMRE